MLQTVVQTLSLLGKDIKLPPNDNMGHSSCLDMNIPCQVMGEVYF